MQYIFKGLQSYRTPSQCHTTPLETVWPGWPSWEPSVWVTRLKCLRLCSICPLPSTEELCAKLHIFSHSRDNLAFSCQPLGILPALPGASCLLQSRVGGRSVDSGHRLWAWNPAPALLLPLQLLLLLLLFLPLLHRLLSWSLPSPRQANFTRKPVVPAPALPGE